MIKLYNLDDRDFTPGDTVEYNGEVGTISRHLFGGWMFRGKDLETKRVFDDEIIKVELY